MREIKFEVAMKTDDGNMMCLPCYICGDDIIFKRDEKHVHAWHCNSVKISDYNVKGIRQYTGLKDKNGKEIYEGDIVEHYCDWKNKRDCCHSVHPIIWEESGFTFPGCGFILNQKEWGNLLKVIGNIYENPEMLENI